MLQVRVPLSTALPPPACPPVSRRREREAPSNSGLTPVGQALLLQSLVGSEVVEGVMVVAWVTPGHCTLPFSRLIGHTPSYCDESLFGTSKAGSRTAVEAAAKLRTLFWTPPATPRGSHSPRPRETPLRAIHPAGPSGTEPRVGTGSQKLSQDGVGVARSLGQRRSHSLTHLTVPSTGHPASSAPQTNGPWSPQTYMSGATIQSPWVTPKACSGSVSGPATPQRGACPHKPKPPWK